MKVIVSGASGLLGKALVQKFQSDGHEVLRLVRHRASDAHEIEWDPEAGKIDAAKLEGCDAVVHLAGENVFGRWTEAKKERIRASRIIGTRCLVEALKDLNVKPRVFVCASAIGFYGDRGNETLTEDSGQGTGFLAGLCREWEEACMPAEKAGIRVVNLRIGVVLTTKGGALAKMLPPFQFGAGGILGSGRQYMSWVSLADMVEIIGFAVSNENLRGPVNAVSPAAVTNAEFTSTLGKVLGRPTIFPVPGFGAKLIFGQMAEELLLGGAKIMPKRLEQAGYKFKHASLDSALREAIASQS